jgi:preprotein translocase subunit YajC
MFIAQQTTQGSNPLVALLPLILLGFVFYFLMIRPQQRRARQQQALVRSIEVGDEVVTGGGIFGVVVDVDDDEDVVTLEIADGVQIHILRAGIGRKIESYDDDEEDEEDAPGGRGGAGLDAGQGSVVLDDQPDQTKEL